MNARLRKNRVSSVVIVSLGSGRNLLKRPPFLTASEKDKLIAQCIFASGFFVFISDVTFENTDRENCRPSRQDLS